MRLPVLALCAALLSAGCFGAQVEPAALPAAAPAALPAQTRAHAGEALAPLPAALPAAFAILREVGHDAFEPTLGVAPDGTLFYAAYADGVAIGVGPLVLRSRDNGTTWEDVSPRLPTGHPVPPETNDPYLYVDPATGRVFQVAMAPILVCSVLSWSDDQGETWTTNPRGCGTTPPWDHQTMVAAKPRAATTRGYPNVLHQCTNQLAATWCARSLDGGLTWSPGVPIRWEGGCHGLHGHLVAGPDGTVYLPKDLCGTSVVAISRDDGLTWEVAPVSDAPTQDWSDPAMAVDAAGNLYYAFVDATGRILLAASQDGGQTWREPVVATPPGVTGHMPALAAGDEGRVVLAYPGTEDLPKGYASSKADAKKAAWHAYLAVTVDALAPTPLFQTTRANDPADPLVRGPCGPARCPGMVDFIDVVVAPDGRPYATFVDACRDACATEQGTEKDNKASAALLATLAEGPLLIGPP